MKLCVRETKNKNKKMKCVYIYIYGYIVCYKYKHYVPWEEERMRKDVTRKATSKHERSMMISVLSLKKWVDELKISESQHYSTIIYRPQEQLIIIYRRSSY